MDKLLVFLIAFCLVFPVLSPSCRASRINVNHDYDIKLYTEKIAGNPDDPELYCQRAAAYSAKGEFDKAIADYTKAMEIDPNYQRAYEYCGMTYIYMADEIQNGPEAKTAYEKAIAVYSKLMLVNPQSAEAYYRRGEAYHKLGNHSTDFAEAKAAYDRAVADYSKSITLNKEYRKAYGGRDEIYMETGEYGKAIADYTYLIGIAPYPFEGDYYHRGYAYVLIGEYGKALEDYNKVIKLDQGQPSYPQAFEERGKLYIRLKKYDEAIADFTRMVERREPKDIVWFVEGRIEKHTPSETDKLKCAEAHYLRAGAYYAKGEYAKAFSDCVRALELCPDYTEARVMKGKLFKLLRHMG